MKIIKNYIILCLVFVLLLGLIDNLNFQKQNNCQNHNNSKLAPANDINQNENFIKSINESDEDADISTESITYQLIGFGVYQVVNKDHLEKSINDYLNMLSFNNSNIVTNNSLLSILYFDEKNISHSNYYKESNENSDIYNFEIFYETQAVDVFEIYKDNLNNIIIEDADSYSILREENKVLSVSFDLENQQKENAIINFYTNLSYVKR